MIFEEGATHGEQSYDFLGADEPWKREWTAEVQAHSWLYLFRPGLKTWPIRYAKFQLVPALRERWLPLLSKRWRSRPPPGLTQGSQQTHEVESP